VVCSMLHSLGRMMATFYLPERWQQVQARCIGAGIDEEQAAYEVLGLSLDEIGRQAGRQWGLPAGLVDSLQDVPPKPLGEPLDHDDWLAAVATLSSRCADALCSGDEAASFEALSQLADNYADMLGLDVPQVLSAIEVAQGTAAKEDAVVVRPLRRNEFDKSPEPAVGKPADAAGLLARGVADMRDALPSANAGQLMSMALETVYQGLGFDRVIAFLRDQKLGRYFATMGFGEGVQELLPRLAFNDAYQPDVFHAALATDKMIFVENAQDPAFLSKVPRWWREALPTVRSFMVLPITVNRQPVGFIYGDWNTSSPTAKIEQPEIAPLNELRTLIVQAVEQRRQMDGLRTPPLL